MIAGRRPLLVFAVAASLLAFPAVSAGGTEETATRPRSDFEALQRIERLSTRPAVVEIVRGFPEAVRGDVPVAGKTAVQRARNFLSEYAALYGTDDDTALHVRRVGRPPANVVTFTQTYKSLPVYGASLTVATTDTSVIGTNGRLLTRTLDDVVPAIAPFAAEVMARKEAGQPRARIVGQTALVVFDRSLIATDGPVGPRLAWRVTVGGGPLTEVIVDAHSADVLLVDVKARGDVGMNSFDLEISDAEGEANAHTDNCYHDSWDPEAADEDGVYGDYLDDPDVVVAYAGAQDAYRKYHEFGRHGYDDDGAQTEIFVHATVWPDTGPTTIWIDCTTSQFMEVTEDALDNELIIHEFGHGVINTSSKLKEIDQPGALEESYADVMAVLATEDWILGDEVLDGSGPVRNLADPTDMATNGNVGADHVSTMAAACPGDIDDEQVHCKAGVPNKAHFLMSDGAPAGIGRAKTGLLTYLAMTNLPSNATFVTARNTELQFAELFRDYWGPNSPLQHTPFLDAAIPQGWTDDSVCGVLQGWAAVGVGAGDIDCDGLDDGADDTDGDGVMDSADNCPGVWPGISDFDGDGLGDDCDPDADGDGFNEEGAGPRDNCPGLANPDQTDADFDGIGEACDPDEDDDFDNDEVLNDDDNCRFDANSDQSDADADGEGNACDPDQDSDGISNDGDNCPFTANASQADGDRDGIGDVCDECRFDADQNLGFTTGVPELGIEPEPFVPDADGDGTPDACDPDPFALGGPLKVNGKKPGPYVLGFPGDRAKVLETPVRAGGELALPLDVCGKRCPDGFDEKVRMVVECRDLPSYVRLWVTDQGGSPVGKYQPGELGGAQARFHPERGNSYVMHLGFPAGYEASTPSLRTSCRLTSEVARTGGTNGR